MATLSNIKSDITSLSEYQLRELFKVFDSEELL